MSVLHTVMAATLALSGTLPGLPSHRKRPANRRPDGSWIMGARERSRLAWRQRVDAAARAYHSARMAWLARVRSGKFGTFDWKAWGTLDAALAAPRPWRSPRKPDPRNHYPRSHRRACRRCDMYRRTMAVVRCAKRYPLVMDAGFYEREAEAWRRNPHGRSGR